MQISETDEDCGSCDSTRNISIRDKGVSLL